MPSKLNFKKILSAFFGMALVMAFAVSYFSNKLGAVYALAGILGGLGWLLASGLMVAGQSLDRGAQKLVVDKFLYDWTPYVLIIGFVVFLIAWGLNESQPSETNSRLESPLLPSDMASAGECEKKYLSEQLESPFARPLIQYDLQRYKVACARKREQELRAPEQAEHLRVQRDALRVQ